MEYTPVVSSDLYGEDEFAPETTIQEALATLRRVKCNADKTDDGVERSYSIRIDDIEPAEEEE